MYILAEVSKKYVQNPTVSLIFFTGTFTISSTTSSNFG